MYDLIIVGGGAAAMSAAVYALSKQVRFLMIYQDLGGKAGTRQELRGQSEEEHVAGADAVRALEREVTAQPERLMSDSVTSVTSSDGLFRVATAKHGVQECLALIVATGAAPTMLDVHGARDLLGHGLGYSATTHSHLFAGKKVAVIGTTPRALRGAAELAGAAAHVYLIAPDEARLDAPIMAALQQLPHTELLAGYRIKALNGPFNVSSIVVEHGDQHRWIEVDAAFAALGLQPNSQIVRELCETDPDGFIVVDERRATSFPGVFAAGDVTTAFGEQLLIAVGDGARAAVGAYDYILAQPRRAER